MVGTSLNHYRITKALGAGGMGEVYLAEDTRLKRPVAIKILPASLAGQPERRDRFEREAQAIAALNHPNIVTVYSVERDGDTDFLTMEYVDGRTLAELTTKSGQPLKRLLTIMRQVVDAVIAAHDKGIVHRDLKPANVMIGAHDRVKVLDFGLAKLRETADVAVTTMPTRELTGEGRIVGTVAYMSPEQAEGKPVDQRSDIFSIGVMLYELATGTRPFAGDTSLSVLTSILRDTPKPITDVNPALPRDLARIIRHCLAKEAERRYQAARDLRNDLDELERSLDSGELTARPFPPVQRGPAGWIAPAGAALLAAVAVGVFWRWYGAPRRQETPPTATYARLTQEAGVEQFANISPDGKWVVYAKNGDVFLQSATGQTPINLTKDSAVINTMPAFSPDGETIAFRSNRAGGGVFVMGRTGESVRRVTTRGFYPSWYPDGRRIIFSTDGTPGPESLPSVVSQIIAADVETGETRTIVSGDYLAMQPRVSPHSQRIAFWAIRSDLPTERYNRDIWTVDAEGKHPVRATTHSANDWNPVWSPDGRWLYFLSNRAGRMNLWRVAIDEATGRTAGDPQPLTTPASYVAHFSLSGDGRTGAYTELVSTGNFAQAPFDSAAGAIAGPIRAITTGTHDFQAGYSDVTSDGRFLVAATAARGQEDLYVVTTADGSIRQLTNDFHRDRAPRWSRDASRVLFYSDRSGSFQLWSIDADGGGLKQLTNEAWRGYPIVSPDGLSVVANDIERHRLFLYSAGDFSKPREELGPVVDPAITNPMPLDWSPDGRQFLYSGLGGIPPSIWAYSFTDRTHRKIVAGGPARWLRDGRRFLYASGQTLRSFDTATGKSRDVLALPGEALSASALASNDSVLFFQRTSMEADIALVRFDAPSR